MEASTNSGDELAAYLASLERDACYRVDAVYKDGRYEAILNNSSVLYIKPAYNITPEITELLNKRYTSEQK